MHQYQSCQEAELSNGIIGTHDGLATFFTSDTHTDVGLLDHSNIIGTITDGKGHDFKTVLDHADDSCLLRGRYTTTQHGATLLAQK